VVLVQMATGAFGDIDKAEDTIFPEYSPVIRSNNTYPLGELREINHIFILCNYAN
jgi:hypothetical protein